MPQVAAIPQLDAWSDDKLDIKFNFKREGDILTVDLTANNTTLAEPIGDFVFQGKTKKSASFHRFLAAVPKTLQLQLLPPSSSTIAPGGFVNQQIRVKNPSKIALKMKLKIAYSVAGNPVQAQGMVGNFPPGAWQ